MNSSLSIVTNWIESFWFCLVWVGVRVPGEMILTNWQLYQTVSSDAQIGDRSLIIKVRFSSLVEHLLSCLFEFTSTIGIANLLGCSS